MYDDPTLDEKPALLEQRGGAYYSEAAVQLAAALLGSGDTASTQVVNVRNDGTLPFLPDDAVIEVPAEVDRAGVRPLPVEPLEPLYAGLVAHVTAYEDLALEAALHGGYERVFQALLAHPLVGQVDRATGSPTAWSPTTATTCGGPEMTERPQRPAGVLAIDAGNSKTDVALVAADGRLVGTARGGPFLPHRVGAESAVEGLAPIVRAACAEAGLVPSDAGPIVHHVAACLANADLPLEQEALEHAVAAQGWGDSSEVVNDTFAVLRAGVDEPRGIAVVCGAGINCSGVLPGREPVRFAAVGHISGDWGGGGHLWQEAMWWAARAEDGRGPDTRLRPALPATSASGPWPS